MPKKKYYYVRYTEPVRIKPFRGFVTEKRLSELESQRVAKFEVLLGPFDKTWVKENIKLHPHYELVG